MVGYELARGYKDKTHSRYRKPKKTLICDLDPQNNATQLLRRTALLQNKKLNIPMTMMRAIQEGNLSKALVKVMPNLYMLPSYIDFYHYPQFLIQKLLPKCNGSATKLHNMAISYFYYLLEPLKSQFDYIIIDVPPTIDTFVNSALDALRDENSFIVVVMQTQERSFTGAEEFSQYCQKFYNNHPETDFQLLGLLPVLNKKTSKLDKHVLRKSEATFGKGALLPIVIHNMERLKRYDYQGISEKGLTPKYYDSWDNRVHDIYNHVVDCIIKRIGVIKNG